MNKLLLLISVAFLFALHGCSTPQYQFCCYEEFAFPENPDDAVCRGMDEEGVEQELEVLACDDEEWWCVLAMDEEGEAQTVPVCPNLETTPCKSNCTGIFCGNFFYDPRPTIGMLPGEEAHAVPDDEDEERTQAILEEPVGLWKAECRPQEMTPLFMRRIENSNDLVMGTFRFGVGSSFQDFELAQYYFPITDRACHLNEGGAVDRYIVYNIPNQKSSGKLCSKTSNKYQCTENSDIISYSYFDCASRCALEIYGYEPEIEPYNPYLTRKGVSSLVGNPFAYAPYQNYDYHPMHINEFETRGYGRDSVRTWGTSGVLDFYDMYMTGTVLYGSSFGRNMLSLDTGDTKDREHLFLELMSEEAYKWAHEEWTPIWGMREPAGDPDTYYISSSMHFFMDWDVEETHESDGDRATNVFLTAEQSPHEVYPWMLAHHSVYNKQFEEGHRTADGSVVGGAEFECRDGRDCMSGYCNNFDYKRSACVDEDGNDRLCDCWMEQGKTLCLGAGAIRVASWDDPNVKVEIPVARPAAIDSLEDRSRRIAGLPSIGTIQDVTLGEEDGDQVTLPLLVFQIGGPGYTKTHSGGTQSFADYNVRSWDDLSTNDDSELQLLARLQEVLDTCSIRPRDWGGWYSIKFSGKDTTFFVCCDGTTDCCTVDNKCKADYSDCEGLEDDDYDDCVDDANEEVENNKVIGHPSSGRLATRFLENCMTGYKSHVHTCYPDRWIGDDHFKFEGFGSGFGPETEEMGEEADLNFCELIADGDYISSDEETELSCYLWESGGHYPQGADTCYVASDAMVVIEPHWNEDAGRWAYGNCLMDSGGSKMELHEYGICESCGYLTMAKQEITAIEEWDPEDDEDPGPDDGNYDPTLPYNNARSGHVYCSDLVIHTPLSQSSLNSLDTNRELLALGPYMMNNYARMEFGSYNWGVETDADWCYYPNGREIMENDDVNWADMVQYRGLPYYLPDAFYLNRKLESMMKRNIQPVLFVTDSDLWDDDIDVRSDGDSGENPDGDIDDAYRVAIQLKDDGNFEAATQTLLKDLYYTRSDIFESDVMRDCPEDPEEGEECTYYATGSFLGNIVLNEGAAILVTEKYPSIEPSGGWWDIGDIFGDDEEDPDEHFHSIVSSRGRSVRFLCPNCMNSVAIGYLPSGWQSTLYDDDPANDIDPDDYPVGEFDMGKRMEEIDAIMSDPDTRKYVDVISLNIYLNPWDDGYCDISNREQRFRAIFSNITWLGRETMRKYQKNLLITDLTIHRLINNDCWDYDDAGEFMAYLGTRSDELVKSGYIGVIYGDWSTTGTSSGTGVVRNTETIIGYRDEFFAGMFTAARNFAGHEFQVYYHEVFVTEECQCVPCDPGDPPWMCNGKFGGFGPDCDESDADLPSAIKWPDNCAREDVCHVGGIDEIRCDVIYNNGTTDELFFETADVVATPSAYRDVIASLDYPTYMCTYLDSGQWVTYTRTEQVGYAPVPLLYSDDGNPDEVCDPTQGMLDSFCGYHPSVGDYKMECEYVDS